jgi:hypothetical protein
MSDWLILNRSGKHRRVTPTDASADLSDREKESRKRGGHFSVGIFGSLLTTTTSQDQHLEHVKLFLVQLT